MKCTEKWCRMLDPQSQREATTHRATQTTRGSHGNNTRQTNIRDAIHDEVGKSGPNCKRQGGVGSLQHYRNTAAGRSAELAVPCHRFQSLDLHLSFGWEGARLAVVTWVHWCPWVPGAAEPLLTGARWWPWCLRWSRCWWSSLGWASCEDLTRVSR